MSDNFRISTTDERLMAWDAQSHAMTTIDVSHRLNHDGFTYSATKKTLQLADDGNADVLIQVPAGSSPHLARIGVTVGAGNVDILGYKDVAFSAAGAAVAAVNTNQNSANVALVTLTSAPTITDIGTEIHRGWVPPTPVGQGQSASGMPDVQAGEEWILAPSVNYVWRITNLSGEAIDLSVDIVWYEINYTRP
jgi:hypothetical protein